MTHDKYRRGGSISPEILRQLKEQKKKEDRWHWSFNLTIIGLIAGGIVMMIVKSFTMMSYLHLVLAILVIAAIAFVLQWKKFYSPAFIQKYFRIPLAIYILYCVGGVAVPACGVLLTANWLGASSTDDIEKHRIVGLDRDYLLDSNYLAVLLLEGDAYQDDPDLRSFEYLTAIKWRQRPILGIVTNKGLLGIPVLKNVIMMEDPDAKPEPQVSEAPVPEPEVPVYDSLTTDSVSDQ